LPHLPTLEAFKATSALLKKRRESKEAFQATNHLFGAQSKF